MQKLDYIYKRHSVRSYKNQPVPLEHIKEIIRAATYAPSGKNMQNWQFIVIVDKEKIAEVARVVEKANAKVATYLQDAIKIKAFKDLLQYHTVFKSAPALVLVYAGPYEAIVDQLLEAGVMPREEALKYARPNPGIQNVAAAMENLQLAAAGLGYGTCWMTGPTYAAEDIAEYIGKEKITPGYFLAAITPLGISAASEVTSPPRKPLEEVLTIIS